MMHEETISNFVAALLQYSTPSGAKSEQINRVLCHFERMARDRLEDFAPREQVRLVKAAYEKAGAVLTEESFRFGDISLEPHLRSRAKAALRKAERWTTDERRALRWLTATELFSHCQRIREHGLTNELALQLHIFALRMYIYENNLGRGKRAMSRRANDAQAHQRKADRVKRLDAMECRIRRGQTVPAAARDIYRLDGLGTSAGANEKLWRRYGRAMAENG